MNWWHVVFWILSVLLIGSLSLFHRRISRIFLSAVLNTERINKWTNNKTQSATLSPSLIKTRRPYFKNPTREQNNFFFFYLFLFSTYQKIWILNSLSPPQVCRLLSRLVMKENEVSSLILFIRFSTNRRWTLRFSLPWNLALYEWRSLENGLKQQWKMWRIGRFMQNRMSIGRKL